MAKFCANCGTSMEDDVVFCPNCGAKDETPAAAPVAPAPDAAVTTFDAVQKKSSKTPVIIGAVAVVAVALIVVLVMVLGGGSGYKKAIDKYIGVRFEGKYSDVFDLAPDAYWDYMEEENEDFDRDELEEKIEEMEEEYEDELEELEDEFGKGIKFSYEVTDEDEISKKDLENINENLEDQYDFDKDSVTEGYDLEITVTVEGDEDSDEQDIKCAALKIDGSWYLAHYSDSYVSFMSF